MHFINSEIATFGVTILLFFNFLIFLKSKKKIIYLHNKVRKSVQLYNQDKVYRAQPKLQKGDNKLLLSI